MKNRQAIAFTVIFLALLPLGAAAQDDTEYRMEIGGGLGSSFYIGDVNTKFYHNQGIAVEGLWRYLFDHYNSLKISLAAGGIKGKADLGIDYYPDDPQSGAVSPTPSTYKFSGTVVDLSCMYELNLLPYGYYSGYMGYKRITPFFQFGLGFSYGTAGKEFTANFPVGFGVKYRLGKRVNLALDWTMHFAFGDKIDGLESPHGIKSEGLKNKDNYCLTMLTMTYCFGPICPNCNKDKR